MCPRAERIASGAGDLLSAAWEVKGVKYAVQVLCLDFQEGAEKSPASAVYWQLKSRLSRENHQKLRSTWTSWKHDKKWKLYTSMLEARHNILSFFSFYVNSPEVINCKYWKQRWLLRGRGLCHVVTCIMQSVQAQQRGEQWLQGHWARLSDPAVSPGLKVHES